MNKSSARKLHRSLAWAMAIGLVYLTLSGVLLNHSKALNLHDINIKNPLLLKWYDLEPPVISQTFSINQHWLTRINQNLYWDDSPLSLQGEIHQVLSYESFLFILQDTQIAFLNDEAQLIDFIALPDTPSSPKESRLFIHQKQLHLLINQHTWSLNADYSEFVLNSEYPISSIPNEVVETPQKPLPEVLKTKLLRLTPSELTLEKVILELHNGYFLGSIGPWLLDLFALLTLIAILSGIRLHLKK